MNKETVKISNLSAKHPPPTTSQSLSSAPQTKRAAEPVRVERGVKTFRRSYTCQVIGTRSIDWLLSLSCRDWTAIYVDASTLDSVVGHEVQERLKGLLQLRLPSATEPVDVILVAAPDEELALRMKGLDWGATPKIIIGRDWSTVNQLNLGTTTRVSHRACGGVTDWKGTVATSEWTFEGWLPKVRQDVLHVIKYSEKPVCCNKTPSFEHLPSDGLVPVYGPWPPVVFHTFATRTNWGSRELLPYELAGALDLPVWLMENEALLNTWLLGLRRKEPFPLKILQATLEAFFVWSSRS